jgi:hypothetical protein
VRTSAPIGGPSLAITLVGALLWAAAIVVAGTRATTNRDWAGLEAAALPVVQFGTAVGAVIPLVIGVRAALGKRPGLPTVVTAVLATLVSAWLMVDVVEREIDRAVPVVDFCLPLAVALGALLVLVGALMGRRRTALSGGRAGAAANDHGRR